MKPRSKGRNTTGLERTIAALRATGRIEGADAATLSLGRTVAERLDREPDSAKLASLGRVQLSVLRTLRGLDDDDRTAGSLDDLLAALSAPMGDAPES
jgi:hypothetical protein